MKNRIDKKVLIIGEKYKTVGLQITEEVPAKMIFKKKEIDLKNLSVLEAEQLVKDGFRYLVKIETPKEESKVEIKTEEKAPSKPKK